MNDISDRDAAKYLLTSIFGIIGYCLTMLPLMYFGWNLLFPCNFQFGTMYLCHLAGEIIIAVLSLFTAENNWLEEFTKYIHTAAAHAAGLILIYAALKGFPDYTSFYSLSSILVLAFCAIVFISFMKMYRSDSALSRAKKYYGQ